MGRPATLLTAAVLVLAAGCAAPPTSATTPTPATAGTTAASATPDAVPTTAPPVTEASAERAAFGLLTAVRVAGQDGADRIVFEFAEAVPGYDIRYVDLPVRNDPQAEEVPLAGTAALQVLLLGASAYTELGDTVPSYPGPSRLAGPGEPVAELVALGDFEQVMVWGAGVTERTGFRVSTLDAPPRLVIDVVRGLGYGPTRTTRSSTRSLT